MNPEGNFGYILHDQISLSWNDSNGSNRILEQVVLIFDIFYYLHIDGR